MHSSQPSALALHFVSLIRNPSNANFAVPHFVQNLKNHSKPFDRRHPPLAAIPLGSVMQVCCTRRKCRSCMCESFRCCHTFLYLLSASANLHHDCYSYTKRWAETISERQRSVGRLLHYPLSSAVSLLTVSVPSSPPSISISKVKSSEKRGKLLPRRQASFYFLLPISSVTCLAISRLRAIAGHRWWPLARVSHMLSTSFAREYETKRGSLSTTSRP